MATLEKIRSKSVLLFVIIIVALLAFILGDFLTSGRTYFGSPTTVAKAGGVTVEYQDYSNRISQLSEQARSYGQNPTSEQLSQQALVSLVQEGLINKEYQALGLTVTDNELKDKMFGQNADPGFTELIANCSSAIGLATPDAATVADAIRNPAKYPNVSQEMAAQMSNLWKNAEDQISDNLLSSKFGSLITGLYTYNNLDARSIYDNVAPTRHIAYVSADASSVADADIEFSDADVQALWNERKNQYKLDEPTRAVDYIYVRLEPSTADRQRAAQAVATALEALNTENGIETVRATPHFSVEEVSVPASAINDSRLKNFATTAQVGTAEQINVTADGYTLARLNGTSTGIDSICVTVMQVLDTAKVDTVLTALNAGATAASLSDGQTLQGTDSEWLSLIGPNVDPELAAELENAQIGKAFAKENNVNGTPVSLVYQVKERKAPVTVYNLATATYPLEASPETIAELNANLHSYISNNSDATSFSENAIANGYPILNAEVSASSLGVGSVSDSRPYVKWIMKNGKGKVSPVFQDDKQTYLIAIAVKDIYNDYRPFNSPSIYPQLTTEARQSKKAAVLMDRYNGKADNLAGYAQLMGAEVAEGDVNLSSPILLNMGVGEGALQGAIAAAQQGKLTGPVQGKNGILVFEVQSINADNRPFDAAEYGQRFVSTYNPLRAGAQLLLGKEKIDNLSLNFIANPAE